MITKTDFITARSSRKAEQLAIMDAFIGTLLITALTLMGAVVLFLLA